MNITIHAPHTGVWNHKNAIIIVSKHYNPRTPTGCDYLGSPFDAPHLALQPTHPLRSVTIHIAGSISALGLQLTHPLAGCDIRFSAGRRDRSHYNSHTPCGVWPQIIAHAKREYIITTHTPLAGCDDMRELLRETVGITTHTPHAGCDRLFLNFSGRTSILQFTHPSARCGLNISHRVTNILFYNPRTPCRVRPKRHLWFRCNGLITIHAPLSVRGNIFLPFSTDDRLQSTHPMQGVTGHIIYK